MCKFLGVPLRSVVQRGLPALHGSIKPAHGKARVFVNPKSGLILDVNHRWKNKSTTERQNLERKTHAVESVLQMDIQPCQNTWQAILRGRSSGRSENMKQGTDLEERDAIEGSIDEGDVADRLSLEIHAL